MKSINESRKICLVPVLLARDFRVNYRECIPPMWIMDLREDFDPRARCIKHFTRVGQPLVKRAAHLFGFKNVYLTFGYYNYENLYQNVR